MHACIGIFYEIQIRTIQITFIWIFSLLAYVEVSFLGEGWFRPPPGFHVIPRGQAWQG